MRISCGGTSSIRITWRPIDLRYLLGGKLVESNDCSALVTLLRRPGQGPFSDSDVACVRRIEGHLQRAAQLHLAAGDLRARPDERERLRFSELCPLDSDGRRLAYENVVQVLDAATNRIVQTAEISDGPDQISYSALLAYVRRRGSEIVMMIPLAKIGAEGRPIGVADFPGGQHALGDGGTSLADSIVTTPEGPAVLVANPADKMIYLYKRGHGGAGRRLQYLWPGTAGGAGRRPWPARREPRPLCRKPTGWCGSPRLPATTISQTIRRPTPGPHPMSSPWRSRCRSCFRISGTPTTART